MAFAPPPCATRAGTSPASYLCRNRVAVAIVAVVIERPFTTPTLLYVPFDSIGPVSRDVSTPLALF
tara:strand:+ start:1121 stop:1318 length:198 start_codon:yes stop_codon:yes gene_type:complete